MNLAELSYSMLHEAITKGTITLENGVMYKVSTSQLITITKFLIQTAPISVIERKEEGNIPEEMLLFPL